MSSPTASRTDARSGYAVNLAAIDGLLGSAVHTDAVLARAGTARAELAHRRFISAELHYAIWRSIEQEFAPIALPLHIARGLSFERFSPVLFAAACSADLHAAATRIAEHKPLIAPTRLELAAGSMETELVLSWPAQIPPPDSLALSEVLFWVALGRLGTEERITPLKVEVPVPPAEADAYEEYLGVPIQPGRRHAVVFSTIDAARPFVHAAEPLWEYFAPELRRQLDDVMTDRGIVHDVRAALFTGLPVGQTSIEEVSERLTIGVRTLQRRLRTEGSSFQAVLGDVRHELARHYLTTSDLPIEEIAFLLGYEDHHSFYRAFQSWSGETPGALRVGRHRETSPA